MTTANIKRPTSGWNVTRTTTHPGEMLREEFLNPLSLSAHQLAMKTRLPASRIGDILHGRRGVSADTALRFARFFGNSPEFWMNLQSSYDLSSARAKSSEIINRDVQRMATAN